MAVWKATQALNLLPKLIFTMLKIGGVWGDFFKPFLNPFILETVRDIETPPAGKIL